MKILQDNKGNNSSFRLAFLIIQALIGLTILIILFILIKESYKEIPNYADLAKVITALLGSGTLNFGLKAIQKKFE